MWQPSELTKQLLPGLCRQTPISTANSGLVKLMVDGKEFHTTSKTLGAVEGSRLAELIRTGAGCVQDYLGVVHVYYDPGLFSIMLHYLRTGRLLLRGYTPKKVLAAAEYWRLPGLVALCQSRMDAPSVINDNPEQSLSEDQLRSSGSAADASRDVECTSLQTFNDDQQRSGDCAADASPVADEKLQQMEQTLPVPETNATSSGIDARKAFRCEELELMLFFEAAEKEDVAVLQQKMRRHPSMRSLKENSEPLDAPDADAMKHFSDKNLPYDVSQASEECSSSASVEKKKRRRRGGRGGWIRRKEAMEARRNNDAIQTVELGG